MQGTPPMRSGSTVMRSNCMQSAYGGTAARSGALALWFVLDTGMSAVLGHPSHALFNVPIAVDLAVPLEQLRSD